MCTNVEIGPARDDEMQRALTLVYTPPGPEAVGLCGGEARAQRFGRGLHEIGALHEPGDHVLVARHEDELVGVLVAGGSGSSALHWTRLAALLALALRVFPVRELPHFVRRGWLRRRLDLPVPAGTLHVRELHVDPRFRGRGIGGALLGSAEALALASGFSGLSLTTLSRNPARRLYERLGYRVIEQRDAPGYEALTGSTGRVLLAKSIPRVNEEGSIQTPPHS